MANMQGHIDYANVFFRYPTPTPIRGEPNYESIRRLKDELRANASSVECDLGGGNHGYLGLVLTDAEYGAIDGSPPQFVPPTFPPALTIPTGTDLVTAVHLREAHRQAIADYRECKNVERALLRHVQGAVEARYLDTLVDPNSRLIEQSISDVLAHLKARYGTIPLDVIKNKEAEVRAIIFNPAEAMVTIFKPVEDLRKLAIAADVPYTDKQLLSIALNVINNTMDFERAQEDWNNKDPSAKTWGAFKDHFRKAQEDLRKIRGPSMRQAGFHHANMLADQLRADMTAQSTEMVNIMRQMLEVNETTEAEDNLQQTQQGSQQETVNAAIEPMAEMMRLLRDMQQELRGTRQNSGNVASQGQGENQNNRQSGRGRRARQRRSRQGQARQSGTTCVKCPDDLEGQDREAGRPMRQATTMYCWTHGMWNHLSGDCRFRAPGHQVGATPSNKLGGSLAYCS